MTAVLVIIFALAAAGPRGAGKSTRPLPTNKQSNAQGSQGDTVTCSKDVPMSTDGTDGTEPGAVGAHPGMSGSVVSM